MTTMVKGRTGIVIPTAIQRQAGIKRGDRVEFKVSGGIISILPKLPSAESEYTSAQRRIIDARLAQADDDLCKGRTYGPFKNASEMITSMKAELRKRTVAKRHQRSR